MSFFAEIEIVISAETQEYVLLVICGSGNKGQWEVLHSTELS